jgi:hypothetical protein
MWVSSCTLTLVAGVPPIVTVVSELAKVKLVPVMMVLVAPGQKIKLCPEVLPELGEIDVTVGGAANACVAAAISSTAAAKMPSPRRRILAIGAPIPPLSERGWRWTASSLSIMPVQLSMMRRRLAAGRRPRHCARGSPTLRQGFIVAADRAAEDLSAADDRVSGSNEECDCAERRSSGARPHHAAQPRDRWNGIAAVYATQLYPTHNHTPQVCIIRNGLTLQVISSDPN